MKADEAGGTSDNEKMIMFDYASYWDRYDHPSLMLCSSMPRAWFKEQKSI